MPLMKPVAPQPIKEIRHKTNIWLIMIPIIFIAVIFILYVFAWEESMSAKKVNQVVSKSKIALNSLVLDSQEKINELQLEIKDLKSKIQDTAFKLPCVDGFVPGDRTECFDPNVEITGRIATDVMQHPRIVLDIEMYYEYHYIDTANFGQIQALRIEKMECKDKIKLSGTMHIVESAAEEGKDSYQGYYMMVSNYECIENYSCQVDSDCLLHRTSCDPCGCLEVTNKENELAIKCFPSGEDIICDTSCPQSEAKCIAGYCEVIEIK